MMRVVNIPTASSLRVPKASDRPLASRIVLPSVKFRYRWEMDTYEFERLCLKIFRFHSTGVCLTEIHAVTAWKLKGNVH